MTVSRHDGVIKKSCDLDYYFVFFNDPMLYYTHAKFHSWFKIYGGGPFASPFPGYLMPKKPSLVSIKIYQ